VEAKKKGLPGCRNGGDVMHWCGCKESLMKYLFPIAMAVAARQKEAKRVETVLPAILIVMQFKCYPVTIAIYTHIPIPICACPELKSEKQTPSKSQTSLF